MLLISHARPILTRHNFPVQGFDELQLNLIFRRRAAVDALEQRLLDANRTIGQPNKLTLIFGRRITGIMAASSRLSGRICPACFPGC